MPFKLSLVEYKKNTNVYDVIMEAQELYLSKKKLNLGCNKDVRETHLNVDLMDPGEDTMVDLQCDIMKLGNVDPNFPVICPSSTAEEILAYDVLEHFPFASTKKILTDWIDILAPGGTLIVRTPDMERIASKLLTGTLPAFEAQRLLFGGQDYKYNFHMAGFTAGMLEGYVLGCGCTEVVQLIKEEETHNVTIVARK